MYANILVPLALSAPDDFRPALDAARKLATPGARITLLHVIEEVPAQVAGYLPPDYLEGIRRDRIADLAHRAEGLSGVVAEVAQGNPASCILERAEAEGSDCIIIASHRPGLRDWFLGSTAARVVRHAQCAVLVMR